MHYFFWNIFTSWALIWQIENIVMTAKEKGTKVLIIRGKDSFARMWPYKSSVNSLFPLKSSFILLCIDETNWIHSNYNWGRVYQNWKFYAPQGCEGLIRTKSNFDKVYHYSAHWLLLGYYAAFLGLLIYKYEPSWISQCSDETLIFRCPLMPVGFLLIYLVFMNKMGENVIRFNAF